MTLILIQSIFLAILLPPWMLTEVPLLICIILLVTQELKQECKQINNRRNSFLVNSLLNVCRNNFRINPLNQRLQFTW